MSNTILNVNSFWDPQTVLFFAENALEDGLCLYGLGYGPALRMLRRSAQSLGSVRDVNAVLSALSESGPSVSAALPFLYRWAAADPAEHDPAEAKGFGSGEGSCRHHTGVGRHRREQCVERDQPGEHECAQQRGRCQRPEVHAVSVDAASGTFNGLRRKSG